MKATDRVLRSNRQRYQLFRNQGGLCGICGEALDDDFQIDHRTPKKRGGATTYQNLQAVHPLCNQKKGSKMPLKFTKALPGNKRLQIIDAVELIIERYRAGEMMTTIAMPPRFGKSSVIRLTALELFPEIGMPSVMVAPWIDNVDQILDSKKVVQMFEAYGISSCKFGTHRCRHLESNNWWRLSERTPTFIACTIGLINHAANQQQFLDGISDMRERCGRRIPVFVDEAHIVKDAKALGQLVRKIIDQGGYVALLTGTPVPGIPGFQQQCAEWQDITRSVYARRIVDGEQKHFIDRYEGAGRDIDSIKADFNVTWEEAFNIGALSKANAVWVDVDVRDEETDEALGPLSEIPIAALNGRLKTIMENDELMSKMVDAGLGRLKIKLARPSSAAARMLVITGRDSYIDKPDRAKEANKHAKKYETLLREGAENLGLNLRIEIATGVDKEGEPDHHAADRIKDFRAGKIDVLIVKSMGIVGLDVPENKVLLFGCTMREGAMAIQALSRALTAWGDCRADLVMARDAKMVQLYERVIKDKGGEWRETDLTLVGSEEIEVEPQGAWSCENARVGAYSDEQGLSREGDHELVLSLVKAKYDTNGMSDLQIIQNCEIGAFPITEVDRQTARDKKHRVEDLGIVDLDAGLDSRQGKFGTTANTIVNRYIDYSSNPEAWRVKLRELQHEAKMICGVPHRKVNNIDDVALLEKLIAALDVAETRVFGHGNRLV